MCLDVSKDVNQLKRSGAVFFCLFFWFLRAHACISMTFVSEKKRGSQTEGALCTDDTPEYLHFGLCGSCVVVYLVDRRAGPAAGGSSPRQLRLNNRLDETPQELKSLTSLIPPTERFNISSCHNHHIKIDFSLCVFFLVSALHSNITGIKSRTRRIAVVILKINRQSERCIHLSGFIQVC